MSNAHLRRLNEIAKKHGLPLLSGALPPGTYISRALDIAMVELGILRPDLVKEDAQPEPDETPESHPNSFWLYVNR